MKNLFTEPRQKIYNFSIFDPIKIFIGKKVEEENLRDFFKETNSLIGKKILENFEMEIKKFKQVCPIEMLDKLDNPITLKSKIKKAS